MLSYQTAALSADFHACRHLEYSDVLFSVGGPLPKIGLALSCIDKC